MSPRQSVELLPDPAGEQAVREVWSRLAEAGLPSLASHRSPSNRPHVTLATAPTVRPEAEAHLVEVVAGHLPLTAGWGDVTTFGPGPYAVVRLVSRTPALVTLQAAVAAAVEVPDDDLTAPARWTPHVSLAVRVAPERLEAVLAEVAPALVEPVTWTSVRRWDPGARRTWAL